uniref:Odorant receptor n=1 Tax=Apolygus lucorum TaxID=248454 RepID=A0A4P8PFX6_APOLU|nr:olfactory receptor protein 69 [Apolygus lucorum]
MGSRVEVVAQNMGSVTAKMDKWEKDEQEDVMKLFKEKYGPLIQLALIFPSWKSSSRSSTIMIFVLHSVVLLFHWMLIMISIKRSLESEWNFEMLTIWIHFAFIVFFVFIVIFCVNNQRSTYFRQYQIMSNDIGHHRGADGSIYETDGCISEAENIKREMLLYMIIPVLIFLFASTVYGLPYISKWLEGMENPYTLAMVNMNLPVPAWYPFPTHAGLGHFTAMAGQALVALSVGVVLITIILLFLTNALRIKFEFRVICYALQTLFTRSTTLFLQMQHDMKDIGNSEHSYQRVIGSCLVDIVVHHRAVSELISIFEKQVFFTCALGYMVGTIGVGLSLVNILEAMKVGNYVSVLTFSMMASMETLLMFTISQIGETITEESVKLRHQVYDIEWHKLDTQNRKILLIFQTAITEPIIVKAGGVINMCLDTFSNIMNMSYSFFNLMTNTN